jgi:hypothetical protein
MYLPANLKYSWHITKSARIQIESKNWTKPKPTQNESEVVQFSLIKNQSENGGRRVIHDFPRKESSAEVKNRVELYLYCFSVPSWPVVGRTFTRERNVGVRCLTL